MGGTVAGVEFLQTGELRGQRRIWRCSNCDYAAHFAAAEEHPCLPFQLRPTQPFCATLQMNPTSANEGERSQRDEEPEKNSLKERMNTYLAESLYGETRSNEKERHGQADTSKMLKHWINGLEDRYVSIE